MAAARPQIPSPHETTADPTCSQSKPVANSDLIRAIEARLRRSEQQARREQELQLTQIKLDSLTLINKLLAAQKMILLTREQLEQLHRVIPLLQGAPLPADFAGILSTLELYRNLRDQERKMRRDLAELNAVMWFVDEAKWGSPATPL